MAAGALQRYQDEIWLLEEEIARLTEQSQAPVGVPERELQAALERLPPANAPAPSEQAAELQRLEAELAYLEELSGVQFTDFRRETLERRGARSLCRYRVSGRCCALPFQAEFQLWREPSCSRVAALAIALDSAEGPPGLGALVSRAEERGGLLLFLRTLAALAEGGARRRAAFAGLQARYPEAVRLPEGAEAEQLLLRDPAGTGCQLLVVWRLHVSAEGAVSPRLDLLPRVPEQALAMDAKRVAERAPAAFRALLGACGIEGALESLVRAFAL